MKTLQAGDKAPQFSLQNQNDETVSLADFAGKKVLVYFYPKAMTPGCTAQAQGLRDVNEELAAKNVVVLGLWMWPLAMHTPQKCPPFLMTPGNLEGHVC